MKTQCTWTQSGMPRSLCFRPSIFLTFSIPEHFLAKTFRRAISHYPSPMATLSTTEKDAVSGQSQSTQKTQQPLQVNPVFVFSLFSPPPLIFKLILRGNWIFFFFRYGYRLICLTGSAYCLARDPLCYYY